MVRYGLKTKMSPEEVMERATAFFGEEGLGLSRSEKNPCCVTFEGSGGYITVTATAGEQRTAVDLETREWDYHVERFMQKIR